MKKWTALLCSAAILVTQCLFTAPKAYADDISIDQKASILNQAYILTGDGTSYNLEGQLKRSEASAFIVKALGVQNRVLQQKDSYSQTSFKDVPKTEWYAPYVGYMTQNSIITGYPDGTFRPDEYISEKAFFSLVLKAMGYTSSDFDWDSINKKAYEAGLVEDMNYLFKSDDNVMYKRSDVVNTLFNALRSPLKGQNKKFVQLLVEGKMITPEKAELFGFDQIDKVPTIITNIRVVNYSQIAVTFNEQITLPESDQLKITLKNNPSQVLNVKGMKMDGNTLVIDTDAQADKQVYTVEVSNVTDTLGNRVSSLKTEFTGYTMPEIASPYFMLAKVEPVNQKAVNVYFTHPLDSKADLELLYDIYKGDTLFVEGNYKSLTVKRYDTTKNMMTISLKNETFTAGETYTLRIKGDLKSAYSVNLNKGNGDSVKFTGASGLVSPITLNNVYSQEGQFVYVTFSNKVDRETAGNIANYTVREYDSGRVLNISQVYGLKSTNDLDKTFVLKTEGLYNSKTYEISVRGVYDAYKTAQQDTMTRQFVGSNATNDYLKVESVNPINNTTFVVSFNRELKSTSVTANVVVEGGLSVVYKEIDPDNAKNMKVYLSASTPLQVGRPYVVRFYTGITDYMDKVLANMSTAVVIGNGVPRDAVAVTSAYFVDDSSIMIQYSQAVSKASSTAIDKYKVFYTDGGTELQLIPSAIEQVSDRVVILRIPYVMKTGKYRVEARNVADVSGQFPTPLLSVEVK